MRQIQGIEGLKELVGSELGVSDWLTIEQERVDLFAEATGDHQWIHVDPERAKSGPFGTTIAHGYLTLSLGPLLLKQVWNVEGIRMAINYGLNRVRFPHPVPVGSRLRLRAALQGLEPVGDGVQATVGLTFELDGVSKPACVAEALFRYYS
jgi:acyl dehydratase